MGPSNMLPALLARTSIRPELTQLGGEGTDLVEARIVGDVVRGVRLGGDRRGLDRVAADEHEAGVGKRGPEMRRRRR